MDREDAVYTIYEIINSGILKEDLEDSLIEIANAIENDDWQREATICEP